MRELSLEPTHKFNGEVTMKEVGHTLSNQGFVHSHYNPLFGSPEYVWTPEGIYK